MKRLLKHSLNRFLPDGARASLKRRWAGKFNSPIEINLLVEKTKSGLCCQIDNAWSFLAPLVSESDLNHYITTPEGRSEFQAIVSAAKEGGTLFDIGAHSGLISALFCAANPKNRVFSFEPSPVSYQRLSAICQLNRFGERMRVEQVGIGEKTETIEMLLDPVGGFIQSQRFDHTMWASPQTIQVRLERIADAATRLNVVPQFIKIDIEGYEYEAIKGSAEFLAHYKPTLFLELHLNYLDQRKLSGRVVVEMLHQVGYQFYTFAGSRLKTHELYDSPLANIHFVAR